MDLSREAYQESTIHSCKETILKYFDEFTAYINGQDVYVMFDNGDHRLVAAIDDFSEEVKYIVIKDAYFTFRKAIVEGKVVQCDISESEVTGPIWKDMKLSNFKNYYPLDMPLDRFRIKPDEPKFKVGDYAYITNDTIVQVTCTHLVHGTEHMKPWTLEEAADDDWVIAWDNGVVGSRELCTKQNYTINGNYDNVVPYIGQTLEELI